MSISNMLKGIKYETKIGEFYSTLLNETLILKELTYYRKQRKSVRTCCYSQNFISTYFENKKSLVFFKKSSEKVEEKFENIDFSRSTKEDNLNLICNIYREEMIKLAAKSKLTKEMMEELNKYSKSILNRNLMMYSDMERQIEDARNIRKNLVRNQNIWKENSLEELLEYVDYDMHYLYLLDNKYIEEVDFSRREDTVRHLYKYYVEECAKGSYYRKDTLESVKRLFDCFPKEIMEEEKEKILEDKHEIMNNKYKVIWNLKNQLKDLDEVYEKSSFSEKLRLEKQIRELLSNREKLEIEYNNMQKEYQRFKDFLNTK